VIEQSVRGFQDLEGPVNFTQTIPYGRVIYALRATTALLNLGLMYLSARMQQRYATSVAQMILVVATADAERLALTIAMPQTSFVASFAQPATWSLV